MTEGELEHQKEDNEEYKIDDILHCRYVVKMNNFR